MKMNFHFESLRLEWTEEVVGDEYNELLLDSLQPHENLKVLFIERHRGQSFPKWMMGMQKSFTIWVSSFSPVP